MKTITPVIIAILTLAACQSADKIEKEKFLKIGRGSIPGYLLKTKTSNLPIDRAFLYQLRFSNEDYDDNLDVKKKFENTKINFFCESMELEYAFGKMSAMSALQDR